LKFHRFPAGIIVVL